MVINNKLAFIDGESPKKQLNRNETLEEIRDSK
jgi:hypothetical protein